MTTVVALISDLHVGHPYAVCPESWLLHDGNRFNPNALQNIIRGHWREFWQLVGVQRRGRRLIVCVVGDVIEGRHHNSTQVITLRLDTQEAMASAVLKEGLELAKFSSDQGDVLRFVTGTSAHDGGGADSLERIARELGKGGGQGRATVDHWRVRIDGIIFDIAHHPGSGPGFRNWLRGNVFQNWLRSIYLDALELKQPVPRYIIRGHWHIPTVRHVYDMAGNTVVTGCILPAWKVKDEYIYTRRPEGLSCIGGAFVVIDNNVSTLETWIMNIEQDALEDL